MEVERQMGSVDGDIIREKKRQPLITWPNDGEGICPEHTVVKQEHAGISLDGIANYGQRKVHSGRDMGDLASVRELKPIHRRRIVLDLRCSKLGVEKSDDFGKRCHVSASGAGRARRMIPTREHLSLERVDAQTNSR